MQRQFLVLAALFPIALTACGKTVDSTAARQMRALESLHTTAPVNSSSLPSVGTGFKTVYQFQGGTDAAGVQAQMIAVDGLLYGVSHDGGTGNGTIFRFDPATSVEKVLYAFQGGNDGWGPAARLTYAGGMFYGTTSGAPEPGYPNGTGTGTVFSFTKSGVETVLHDFAGSPDGANPEGYVLDVKGTLYGTTFVGGTGTCSYSESPGCGTVFSLNRATGTETVIHSFGGEPSDGAGPRAGLIDIGGTLYGSTYFGGTQNDGTVFSIAPDGHEKILHNFTNTPDGDAPQSELTLVNGVMFGITNGGGRTPNGVVYGITPSGTEKVVLPECCGPEGATILLGASQYGTTSADGSAFGGTVFALTEVGTEEVLHNFRGGIDGGSPEDALTALNGMLYGTTRVQGAYNVGTIFRINP